MASLCMVYFSVITMNVWLATGKFAVTKHHAQRCFREWPLKTNRIIVTLAHNPIYRRMDEWKFPITLWCSDICLVELRTWRINVKSSHRCSDIEHCLDRFVLNRSLSSRSHKSSTYSKQTCKKWLRECSLLYQGNQHIKRGCETRWFLCWCRCHNFA